MLADYCAVGAAAALPCPKGKRMNSSLEVMDEEAVNIDAIAALVEQLAQEDGNRAFISTTPTTPDEGRMELHEPSDTMRMMVWDMNGSPAARRSTWYDQVERCDAVLYVFDCGDLGSLDGA